jgi:hypothetical protein
MQNEIFTIAKSISLLTVFGSIVGFGLLLTDSDYKQNFVNKRDQLIFFGVI